MRKKIAVLPGDGVGPEVISEAVKVLKKIAKKFKHHFFFESGLIGHAAIEQTGDPFPPQTEQLCRNSDAILFGAIGHPKYDQDPKTTIRPEQGLLRLRKTLELYANIRPIKVFSSLTKISPLKKEIVTNVDFIVIRELIGGIYFGQPRGRDQDGERAFETSVYTREEIERVSLFAFHLARKRKRKITLVDKANVLETSRLWRETVQTISNRYPEIIVDYMYVDNAAMQIIKNPRQFDLILTENMFGDILTDEAAVIVGSLGMLPSASIGKRVCLYEPIHGSYPKAAGKNIANPVGAILSAAMMLDYSFNLKKESQAIINAVELVLTKQQGTKDINPLNPVTTSDFGQAVIDQI